MIKDDIEGIYQDFKKTFITSPDWGFEFSDAEFKEWLTAYVQKAQREAVEGFDSMLVELWNFFALETEHHGKGRGTGGFPSLERLHYFMKQRGLINGSGNFNEKGKQEYLKTLETEVK